MDFTGRVFLASIEEDNAQRVLFRVRPLLDAQGLIRQEEIDELGDEGYLRIVPDRHEQYSFKERMRTLGALCVLDFRRIQPEAMKVRQNKNYAPQRGESNRYVLYSDVVRPLEEHPLFEVVADKRAEPPLTRQYYQRKGGHIQGPYNRADEHPVDALSCIAPDSDRLFAISEPGGRERLFFWPEATSLAEQAPEPLSAAERIRRLDAQLHREREGGAQLMREGVPPAPEGPSAAPLLNPPAEEKPAAPALSDMEAACRQFRQYMESAGFLLGEEDAAHLLTLSLLFPAIRLRAGHPADARLAERALRAALGMGEGGPLIHPLGAKDAPSEEMKHCPGFFIRVKEGFALAAEPARPLQFALLRDKLAQDDGALPEEALARLQQMDQQLRAMDVRLPLQLRQDMLRYLKGAQALLPGGERQALDYACLSFLMPFLKEQGLEHHAAAALLEGLPLCQAAL